MQHNTDSRISADRTLRSGSTYTAQAFAKRKILFGPIVFGALLFSSCHLPLSAANLVVDGGFENPITGPGGVNSGYTDFASGSAIGTAWKVVGSELGRVAIYPNTETLNGTVSYNVVEGSQALDLTGDMDNGAFIGVEQIIATTPGSAYALSFYVGSTLGQPAIVDTYLNGADVFNATNSSQTIGATNWQQFDYTFTASGYSTILDLYNGSPAGVKTVGLDNVAVAQTTPEPASLGVAGISLIALVARLRVTISGVATPYMACRLVSGL
jgi:hypothetical protein